MAGKKKMKKGENIVKSDEPMIEIITDNPNVIANGLANLPTIGKVKVNAEGVALVPESIAEIVVNGSPHWYYVDESEDEDSEEEAEETEDEGKEEEGDDTEDSDSEEEDEEEDEDEEESEEEDGNKPADKELPTMDKNEKVDKTSSVDKIREKLEAKNMDELKAIAEKAKLPKADYKNKKKDDLITFIIQRAYKMNS